MADDELRKGAGDREEFDAGQPHGRPVRIRRGTNVTHPHVEADSGPVVLEGYGVDAIRQDRHGVFEQRPVLIQIEYSRLFVQLERAP